MTGDPAADGPYVAAAERERVPAGRSESRRRSVSVNVRWTPDEAADLQADAARRGMTAPELLRLAYLAVKTAEEIHRG